MLLSTSCRALRATTVLFLASAVPVTASTYIVDLGLTGGNQPVRTIQPSLGLTALVQVVEGRVAGSLGSVLWFGGNYEISGFMYADGRTLSVAEFPSLHAKFGTTYGGDGTTTFKLPDLRGRAVVGAGGSYSLGNQIGNESVILNPTNLPAHTHDTATGPSTSTGSGQPYNNLQPSLALNYEITDTGVDFGNGFVTIDAANDTDAGTSAAIGQSLGTAEASRIFGQLGYTYGGSGTTFALPDTRDRLVVGAGTGPGLSTRSLGQTQGTATETLTLAEMPAHSHIDPDTGLPTASAGGSSPENNLQPEIALRYVIALQGVFPGRDGLFTPGNDLFTPYLGQIALFAGPTLEAPRGWAFAEGQTLGIAQNNALFAILGTTFGGDGRFNFMLPDLRGMTPIGTGQGLGLSNVALGQALGSERLGLFGSNLPSHSHRVVRTHDDPSVIPLPASAALLLGGLGLLALRRRTRAA